MIWIANRADGLDKVLAAQHQSGRLRSTQIFTAAEKRQGSAHLGEAPEILDGRQLRRGIDDDRNVVLVPDRDHIGERDIIGAVHGALKPENAGGALADGGAQSGDRRFNLDELHANLLDSEVIGVAVCAMDDRLVFEAGDMRKAFGGLRVFVQH